MTAENKSTHKAEVVRISEIKAHPNADKMMIAKVFGWECCIGLNQFKPGDLAVFIQPDSIVPPLPEYHFLKKPEDGDDFPRKRRIIRAKRLRKVWSEGLLVDVPPEMIGKVKEGDDLAEYMRIEHYEPEIQLAHGGKGAGRAECEKGPRGLNAPIYDVDNIKRFIGVFMEREEVFLTEKIHGANALFVYKDDRFWVRSKNTWKRPSIEDRLCFAKTEDEKKAINREVRWHEIKSWFKGFLRKIKFGFIVKNWNLQINKNSCWWWEGLRNEPEIQRFLQENPGMEAWGEVFGKVQKLHYGIPEQVRIRLFDLRLDGRWLNWDEVQQLVRTYNLPWVPLVWQGPFNQAKVLEMAEGQSLIPGANHIREGVVIKPVKERENERSGRIALKAVSKTYLEGNW